MNFTSPCCRSRLFRLGHGHYCFGLRADHRERRRPAVPMNQILSLVTLVTALAVRWHAGSLTDVGGFAPAVLGLGLGGITAAWFAVRLLSRLSDHRLERAIAVMLMAVGALLIGERFVPVGLSPLVPVEPVAQLVVGISLGLCVVTASTFLGVAGGELLIPTLIFVFGADIQTAGSAVLFVSIPPACVGLFRYTRLGLLPSRSALLRIGIPMGVESLVGAAGGGAFAGSASAGLLILLRQ